MMTLEEMGKRLQALEDLEQVKQLQIRYVNCLMFAKWDEIMDCFTDDCVLDVFVGREVPIKGTEEIEKAFRELISRKHIGKEGDIVTHPIVSVDGDKATGNWLIYFMEHHTTDWQPPGWVVATYDAEYVRINGEWKISYIKWTPHFFDTPPPPPVS
jgi:ketosteroid isomerase-like protein